MDFIPTRAAGLAALEQFTPSAGISYTRRRNFDLRPDGSGAVSQLSPYIRHRLISEAEVITQTLATHSPREAEKFIQEVFWRTYWKGWLEMRPLAWAQYEKAVLAGINRLQTEAGLRHNFEAACTGSTDIECFNKWSQDIVNYGYIQNHARMWFASIWIFTLRLPWALGADFFLRHLYDGDPASNTLSWKWVAGLQTEGKTYLARPDNIAEFTENRFQPAPGTLAPFAEPPEPFQRFEPTAIMLPNTWRKKDGQALLLHEDDLWGGTITDDVSDMPIAGLLCAQDRSPRVVADHVIAFARNAIKTTARDCAAPAAQIFIDPEAVIAWAKQEKCTEIVTAYAPVGPAANTLSKLEISLKAQNMTLRRVVRDYDRMCWPHATKGFFPFKKNIPDFLNNLR